MKPESDQTAQIIVAFLQVEVGSYFDERREERVNLFLREVREVEEECARRGHPDAAGVLARCLRKPLEMAALIQSFVFSMTAEMRAMIYLLLTYQDRGAAIAAVRYEYEEKARSVLKVTLRLSDGNDARTETFESAEPWDAQVLNHLSMIKFGDAPLLWYAAFRLPESTRPAGAP